MQSQISKWSLRYQVAKAEHTAAQVQHAKNEYRYSACKEALASLQAAAVLCQTRCQERISNVVTRCLTAVFPDSKYKFRLVFEEKRNQTEARCVLTDASGNEYDPVESTGGGVMDVVAFGLRLACLMLQRPAPEKILILDEPARFLSKQYRGNFVDLLDSLAKELGVQIIAVTHVPEFVRGNVIEV